MGINGYHISTQDKISHPTRIHLNAGNDINDIKCYQFDNVPHFVHGVFPISIKDKNWQNDIFNIDQIMYIIFAISYLALHPRNMVVLE